MPDLASEVDFDALGARQPDMARTQVAGRLRYRWVGGGVVRERVAIVLLAFGGLGLTIALWHAASFAVGRYMPPPLAVFANMTENFSESRYLQGLGLPSGGYFPHLVYTVWNVMLGVTIGVATGLATGLASWRWKIVDEITDPIVTIFGTLPILVAAPFFLIWFGLVAFAQVSLVAFYATIILHLYTLRAARNVDPKYRDYALTLGAHDRAIFRRVIAPAALPEVFGGVRIALAAAWGLAAVAELLGAQFGVGRVIVSLTAVYDVASIMAIVLLLSTVALALDAVVAGVRRWATRWMPRDARI